ncbi:unnamed protein product [Dimorphilus gyrociliatus]|uniref:Uncharacterized protein n=1 Tax=Dimorphilus gyrociliatus TaxID=2664684 RepID=A0A7I8V6P8_9ANNE|nr:unnamed protein product [Dimorphilus gyrociliatus]
MQTWGILFFVIFFLRPTRTIRFISVIDDSNFDQVSRNLEDAIENVNQTILDGKIELHIIRTKKEETYNTVKEICSIVSKGVTAILDFSNRMGTVNLQALANDSGIAHISSVPSIYEPTASLNTTLNIRPLEFHYINIIRTIVDIENLTNVGVIYDSSFDLNKIPKTLLRNLPCQHLYLKLKTSEADMINQLETLKKADLDHLFVAASSKMAAKFLKIGEKMGMMSFKYHWYVMSMNVPPCKDCPLKDTIVQISPVIDESSQSSYSVYKSSYDTSPIVDVSRAYIFDMIHLIASSIGDLISQGKFGNEIQYNDCLLDSSTDKTGYEKATLLLDTIFKKTRSGVTGLLKGIQPGVLEQDSSLRLTRSKEIGSWSKKTGLIRLNGSISENYMQKIYRVVTVTEPPFVFNSSKLPSGISEYYYDEVSGQYYYGYCIELLNKIKDKLKFKYILYQSPDGLYGSMNSTRHWNGMIKELIEDRADIMIGAVSVMAERENVVDFTVPFYDLVGITILMKKPKFEYTVFRFLNVLERAVWGCIFSAFVIVSVLLCVFDKYSPYSYQNNKESWDGQGDEPRVFTLKEGLWFCMTSLTPQGGGEAPRALSGRLVAATWWMFGFIMIATYTANLAAFLTVSRLDEPISSLDDLAKQFKVKYAPQSATATQTYFERMADIEEKFYSIWKSMSLNDSLDQFERAKLAVWDYPVSDKFTNMWAAMKESGFPLSLEEAKNRIKNPPSGQEFAFIGDATQNKYAANIDCALWEVGEEFSRKPYALAVQEGSTLKNQLSSVVLQLLNQRVLEDLKSRWWDFGKVKCEKIEDESDGISIKNIGGVFLVIFIGIGLGLLTLAFEYYWYKLRPAWNDKREDKGNSSTTITTQANSNAHSNGGFMN